MRRKVTLDAVELFILPRSIWEVRWGIAFSRFHSALSSRKWKFCAERKKKQTETQSNRKPLSTWDPRVLNQSYVKESLKSNTHLKALHVFFILIIWWTLFWPPFIQIQPLTMKVERARGKGPKNSKKLDFDLKTCSMGFQSHFTQFLSPRGLFNLLNETLSTVGKKAFG